MSFAVDFGFEGRSVSWDKARLAYFFVGNCAPTELGKLPGPTAIADASRYVELFETQSELSLSHIGAYAEILNSDNPAEEAKRRVAEAKASGIIPVVIGDDRRITELCCTDPLVALWGKVGRSEAKENLCTANRSSVLCGVRAATSKAFRAIPGNVTIITARGLISQPETLGLALSRVASPVHLSIDIDVLAPGTAQSPRSIEPGGLSYYNLTDTLETVFRGPGVAVVDLVGVKRVTPGSPAAALSAQILVKVAGLMMIGREK